MRENKVVAPGGSKIQGLSATQPILQADLPSAGRLSQTLDLTDTQSDYPFSTKKPLGEFMSASTGFTLMIREAVSADFDFVVELMCAALEPYYGGDHKRHAERIFNTHVSGGADHLGFFSTLQKMFIAEVDGHRAGMIHVVGKRQGTMKISPLIVDERYRKGYRVGPSLLSHAEKFARDSEFRQIYCTVAMQNAAALEFFKSNKYVVTGQSDSHYKAGVTELMLYKTLADQEYENKFDREHISVLPYEEKYADQVRALLLSDLPKTFSEIDDTWVTALFAGYERRDTKDINSKFKLIFLALDRREKVRGVVGATPKKGLPIKLMPCIATDLPSFVAILKDVPFFLREYGHKLYIHTDPSPEKAIALQQNGWILNAALPAGYHPEVVTLQWSLDIDEAKTMRNMRVKDRFLKDIEAGKKDLEVRVGYASINNIKQGETIEFSSRTRTVVATVTAIRRYKTFDDLLSNEESNRIVPGMPKEELLRLLREIYPADKESLGVVVLQVAPMKKPRQSA